MTSPIKLENHPNRQQHFQNQHGSMSKNLHQSEVITTAAAVNPHYFNGMNNLHRQNNVDPIEMTKLLSNITTSANASSKVVLLSSTIDYTSRLNHFSWEEIEGRYLPVIFRNENDSLQRYTSKMYVENTLFQSESWQRHAVLARSLPPLISFPYTDHELKLFRSIIEWHLAGFQFKTILPSDCLIRFEDLLDFYSSLRKLRDNSSATSFPRPIPTPHIPPHLPPPPLIPMPPAKLRPSSSNGLGQSFELPTMGGNSSIKSSHRHSSSNKIYPPTLHHPHSPNYLLQQNADVLPPFCNPSTQTFNFNSLPPKVNQSVLPIPPPSLQWTEPLSKSSDKLRLPRSMIPMSNSSLSSEVQILRDKHLLAPKQRQSSIPNSSSSNQSLSRETKESGWVQVNNVFVPYIVRLKLRENDLEKSTRQTPTQVQREFYVPYEILIKCHIFSDNEFAFKKFLIKATQQDFDIFNSLISNINIFDEKVPEKTFLVNLYHVMIGLSKILYVKFLTSKQPRSQVNKYHAEVLTHKGGTLLMHGNKLVPYIIQNNRSYVPLIYAYQSLPQVLSQAKRGARAPRQYEIDYLNLIIVYFSLDTPPFTSDTLLVDAFSIKSADIQLPIHFRTLVEHQQYEKSALLSTLPRLTKANSQITKSSSTNSSSVQKSNKCPPANVVVNPLIHHPLFYGLQPPLPPPPSSATTTTTTASPAKSSTTVPTSNSVVVNPLLLPSDLSTKKSYWKTVKYDNHSFNAFVKSLDQSINESKIPLTDIFQEFTFEIDYDKFIQWCQINSLLPLNRFDDEEKRILNEKYSNDDVFVYYQHLNRCIELLNDLKRGTISMTLLSQPTATTTDNDVTLAKTQLAGAKKRKTTVPTTRHISSSVQSPLLSTSNSNSQDNITQSPAPILSVNEEKSTEDLPANVNDNNDDFMPVVDTIEEEQSIPPSTNSSFIVADSNECDDGKIQLDDTLPSCSSGYESAAALTNLDVNQTTNPSSDDDEVGSNLTARSREHSSSCQSESLAPILSTVSSNVRIIPPDEHQFQQQEKNERIRSRSRSPTLKNHKRKRLSDDPVLTGSINMITRDKIEHHLRTLSMPNHEQKRTRTRPIKTPTRLVEEISANYHYSNHNKILESDTTNFETDTRSSTPTTTDTNSNEPNMNSHQNCVYNVTISNKPNKLGLTIKKVIPR